MGNLSGVEDITVGQQCLLEWRIQISPQTSLCETILSTYVVCSYGVNTFFYSSFSTSRWG